MAIPKILRKKHKRKKFANTGQKLELASSVRTVHTTTLPKSRRKRRKRMANQQNAVHSITKNTVKWEAHALSDMNTKSFNNFLDTIMWSKCIVLRASSSTVSIKILL